MWRGDGEPMSARGGIRKGQPSRRIMAMPIFCPTPLLVSETRYFSNPTRNERSECRVGYAYDARDTSVSETRNYFTPNTIPIRFGFCRLFQMYKIRTVLLTIAYTMVTFFTWSIRIS